MTNTARVHQNYDDANDDLVEAVRVTPRPKPDMVNHPPHYERGPQIECPECSHVRTLQHIEVFRCIKDSRLATAFKYVWRVAFGGKESDDLDKDIEDIGKAGFYLKDFQENPQ